MYTMYSVRTNIQVPFQPFQSFQSSPRFNMGAQTDWHSFEGIVTGLLDGNPIAIIVTALIAFGLPVLLHLVFYRSVASPPSSNFLLLGPSGAGKTVLLSLVSKPFASQGFFF